MKILMVNKFLYNRGGAETYAFELGNYQQSIGNKVSYFGMADSKNIYSNDLGLEVSNVEFRKKSLKQIFYPFRIIYSSEAKQKISQVLDDFKPDYVHLNNINFQLTPSILYAIKEKNIPIIQTLHDYQNICPNHMLYIEHKKEICERCKGGKFFNCVKNKCIHNSTAKSIVGYLESSYYHSKKAYDLIDAFVCPSQFLADKMIEFGVNKDKLHTIHNFIKDEYQDISFEKKDYGIYFGRLSIQKGIGTLIKVMKQTPEINYVIAGGGELEDEIKNLNLPNVDFVGFKSGNELMKLIGSAAFSILPTEWYENCPMSVLESLMLGTPVVATSIGGVPELIKHGEDGFLYTPADANGLKFFVKQINENKDLLLKMSKNAKEKSKNYELSKYQDEFMKVVNKVLKGK